jgi:peptide/nickel transport system permease protein
MTVATPYSDPAVPAIAPRPTLRARWTRRPPGVTLWVGAGLLAFYLFAGLSALVVFRGSLGHLSTNAAWMPPFSPIGPSLVHPFGVLPGFGVDLFQAVWQATPWDLGIVAGVLAIDATVGLLLGAGAGMKEGGLLDSAVIFVGDSLGAIPSFLLVVIAFAGFATVAPSDTGLPVFVAIFGLILWPTVARTVRERARAVSHEPFVEASRASGASSPYLFFRHILPNSLGPVLAQIPLDVAPIFFVLSAYPWFYNCVGPSPPDNGVFYHIPVLPPFSPLPSTAFPEWGFLLGFGTCIGLTPAGIFDYWWMYLFPLLAILGLGFAIGLFCDGIERQRRLAR